MTSKEAVTPQDDIVAFEEKQKQRQEVLNKLAVKIEDEWQTRARARVGKELEWRRCLRLYNAPMTNRISINPDSPFDDKHPEIRPVPNIVRTKCDIAIANGISMQFAAGEKNWDMWPPANDSSEDTAARCRAMEKEIQAQLDYCKYALKARRGISERVILGTGVMKGPVNSKKIRTRYVKSGSIWMAEQDTSPMPEVEHVSVWNFYPDMSVATHAQSESDIELHTMSKLDLSMLKRVGGFDEEVIDEILSSSVLASPTSYNAARFAGITEPMWAQPHMYRERYVVLEYHGPVTYDDLDKIGLTPTYKSPTKEYYGEVWVCAGKVIRIELENIEGAFETPYAVSTWKTDPVSPFGFGNPLVLADAQRVTTACYHMILDNASLTSGPQVSMYQQYIQPADGNWDLSPNKVWLLTDPTVKIKDAIDFFTPQNVIGNIMPVLELARMFAEEESATPATIAGLSSPVAAATATGELAIQRNSTVLLDHTSEEWDDHVTEKLIRRMYGWNMQYNPKDEIKGDFRIDVRTSSEYKNKLIHIRDLEKISIEATQNPALADWINVDELQRARLALMSLSSAKIVRTKEEHDAAIQQRGQQPDPTMIELGIKKQEADVLAAKLQLEQQRLQFDATLQQQREKWDHEERMAANYARIQEAQASVLRAQLESQTEMLKLAQKKDAHALDAQTKMMIAENDNQAKIFIRGMDSKRHEIDQMLTERELDLKETTGQGI